ncbi:MAG: helix-turn-helix domain-containing protein [Methanobrevibacter sp.]|nr:helix-turn-helix domain-containing protein [Methanobrevibacter sp.]
MSLKGFFRDASTKVYSNPKGEDIKLSASTIERWYYNYKASGFDALIPQRRSDAGKPRKLDNDIMEQIKFLKKNILDFLLLLYIKNFLIMLQLHLVIFHFLPLIDLLTK